MISTAIIAAAATLILSWLAWSTAVVVAAFVMAVKRERVKRG